MYDVRVRFFSFRGTLNEYTTKSGSLNRQHDSSIKYQFDEYDWERAVVNEPSKAELLEQIEVLKFELAQAKRQLKKKSYQASVYSKMMQIAMRRLPDEWFPFKDSLATEDQSVEQSSDTGDRRRLTMSYLRLKINQQLSQYQS